MTTWMEKLGIEDKEYWEGYSEGPESNDPMVYIAKWLNDAIDFYSEESEIQNTYELRKMVRDYVDRYGAINEGIVQAMVMQHGKGEDTTPPFGPVASRRNAEELCPGCGYPMSECTCSKEKMSAQKRGASDAPGLSARVLGELIPRESLLDKSFYDEETDTSINFGDYIEISREGRVLGTVGYGAREEVY